MKWYMKGSMLAKFGDTRYKFVYVRASLPMMTMLGKVNHHGHSDRAVANEWHSFRIPLDWHLLEYPEAPENIRPTSRRGISCISCSELWELDDSWDGFQWVNGRRHRQHTDLPRKDRKKNTLLVAVNFPIDRKGYCIGVPTAGTYETPC